ncbi:MAG: FAD-binding oxidoreductase [Xanthomonadales bacterium]|nr:FAD-binding oxidoreductase [Xanthomonadales bacterium]
MLEHAPSYYAASANPSPARPSLTGSVDAEICIIGGGYTGLSAALHLLEAGREVVLLEAQRVGWGASGRNGGQIVHSYSRDMDVIEAAHSADAATALGSMAFEGAQIIRQRIEQYQIACDLKSGGIYAAKTRKKIKGLEEHQALWERYGNRSLKLYDRSEVHRFVATDAYQAILVDESGGHIHPLNLALGEAAAVEQLGGRIHEDSAALGIERGNKVVVRTQGGQVRADTVIVAGNAYLGDLEPKLSAKSMPCGTQVVATEPLGERWREVIPSDYCVEDNDFLLDYYRLSADRRLIFGGGVIYGARDPQRIEALIRPNLERTFPQLKDVGIDYAWTGNFLLTLSRLPQMGRLAPNIYYSQGCSGHGVTFTHLAGRLLSEAIAGKEDRFNAFARLPHYPFPGGRMLRVPFTALGAAWYAMRDRLGL